MTRAEWQRKRGEPDSFASRFVPAKAHERHNLAEYEGHLEHRDVDQSTLRLAGGRVGPNQHPKLLISSASSGRPMEEWRVSSVEDNRNLGLRINKEIWNEQCFENIPHYFTDDFVADYSPRAIREGRDQIEEMVRASHLTFEDFKEEVHHVVADDRYIVVHFTITGKQVGDWGPIPATNRPVKFDEIVIMEIRDGKVCRQIGVSDSLLALQQLGRIPDPTGFVDKSFE